MKVTTRVFGLFLIFIIHCATVGVQSLIPPECQEICAHCNDPTYSIHQCLAEIHDSYGWVCRDCYPGFSDQCGSPDKHDVCIEPLRCVGDMAFLTCSFRTGYVPEAAVPASCDAVCAHCMDPTYPEELCIQEILDQPGDSCYDCYLGTVYQCGNNGLDCPEPLNCVLGIFGLCLPPCLNLNCEGVVCNPCINGVLVFDECKCCPDCQQCTNNSHCPLNHCCNNGACEPAVYQCVDADCPLIGYTVDQCNHIQCSCCAYTCPGMCITYHDCRSWHSCFNGECIPCPPCPFWIGCAGCPPGTIKKLVDKECSCCKYECIPIAVTNIGGTGIGPG